jgi:hypothetical protein
MQDYASKEGMYWVFTEIKWRGYLMYWILIETKVSLLHWSSRFNKTQLSTESLL